jgi:Skp family chaperone for outer membrane proteins
MKKMLATSLFVATAIASSQPSTGPRSAGGLAYVSVQRILSEAAESKAAAKSLEELRRAKADEVARKQKELEATRLALANAGGVFQGSRRAELQAPVKRQQTELQQSIQEGQAELQKAQLDLQERLRRDLLSAIETLARKRGIQLVLNTDTAVVWAATGTDLTAEVLAALNAKPTQKP